MEQLKPCPFCGGLPEMSLQGTQPDIQCDCGIYLSIQTSDHFTYEERFNDPAFAWRDAPHFDYGEAGTQRAREVLLNLWNTRAGAPKEAGGGDV